MENFLAPAAQYLRMSTHHQQYSLENQADAISRYAMLNGFQIVKTYSDAAKSGLCLKNRAGLKQLLKDVVDARPSFRTILVYDVSRWGRFQDMDEAAHYEFLCKSAGIPVHYCAETFSADTDLPNVIMKVFKRTMAAEFSRELGVKVLQGQKRLAALGFKQGSMPGYGLRRLLVSRDRRPKQILASGQRKSIASDHVIIIPGPVHEIEVVGEIYRMFISRHLSFCAIARELNDRGVDYLENRRWDHQAVRSILTNPKYAGIHVFGKTSLRLATHFRRIPQSEWVVTPGASPAIIDQATFAKAQAVFESRTSNKSDEELLANLRTLLRCKGMLSLCLIKECQEMASPSTYRVRFGGLQRAYELIGYDLPGQRSAIDLRRRTQAVRNDLIHTIAQMFPDDLSIVRREGMWRSTLRLREGISISVIISRSMRVWKQTVRWRIEPVPRECGYPTLLARMDKENKFVMDLYLLPRLDRTKPFQIRENDDPWLDQWLRIKDLSRFCTTIREIYNSLT